MDTDKSGYITIDEFRAVVDEKFEFSDEQITNLFQSMGAKAGKQHIHYSEFLAAALSTKVNINNDLLFATFSRFDKNGDGQIDKDELKVIFGDTEPAEEIESMMKDADTNGDGTIDYKEFIEFATKGQGQIAEATGKLIDWVAEEELSDAPSKQKSTYSTESKAAKIAKLKGSYIPMTQKSPRDGGSDPLAAGALVLLRQRSPSAAETFTPYVASV